MMEKYFMMGNEVLIRNFPERRKQKLEHVDCHYCEHHYYDTLFGGDDEYELCEKGHELFPDECEDFEEL